MVEYEVFQIYAGEDPGDFKDKLNEFAEVGFRWVGWCPVDESTEKRFIVLARDDRPLRADDQGNVSPA